MQLTIDYPMWVISNPALIGVANELIETIPFVTINGKQTVFLFRTVERLHWFVGRSVTMGASAID